MMDSKENASNSPSHGKISPDGPPPTLKERMQCLIKLRSAWDTENTPSPARSHSRPSINPASGQVRDMKAKLARLAEELRCRDEEDEKLKNKPQWSLSTQTAAEKEIEAKKHRWTPPSSPKASAASGTLKFRSPSPSRAEMPNSPRGGGSGSVERPNRTPVSARKAQWEEHIATSKVSVSSKPPAVPRTPTSWQKKESAAQLELSSRKESLRRHREHQNDMKYEAGLAAVGFELSPVKTPAQRSQSGGKETIGVKRKKTEDAEEFKRPPGSSLYRIISQPSEKSRDAVAEKKARMLNLMTPYSFGQTHSSEESTPESENFSDSNSLFPDEVAPSGPKLNTLMVEMWRAERRASLCEETMTDVTTATNTESDFDEDNDFAEQSDASPTVSNPAVRRISRTETLEDNQGIQTLQEETQARRMSIEDEVRGVETEEEVQRLPGTVEEVKKEVTVEQEVQRGLIVEDLVQEEVRCSVDAADEAHSEFGVQEEDLTTVSDFEMRESDVSKPDEVMEDLEETGVQEVDNAHYDSETRLKFLQVMGQRPPTPAMGRVSIGRNVRPRRRSSSLSDLRSPCLIGPSYSGKTNSRERGNLAYTVENYRTTVQEGRLSPPAPRVYAMNFSDVDRSSEEDRTDRMVIGVQPRLDAKRIANLKQQASQQEEVIYQATKALHQVMANGRVGSSQHIECSRVLVVACQKRQALLEEAGRLRHDLLPLASPSSSSCVLTLSGVRLVLKEEFRLRVLDEQHHFLCLLRVPGGRVVATEVGGSGSRDWVDIPSCLTVKDLEQGFRVSLEVYGLSLTRQPGEKARGLLQRFRRRGEEEARWTAHAGFSLLASVSLSADSQGQSVFPLRHLPASSPLMPLVQLRLRVNSEPRIELRGFLNVFAEVGGFGSWLRRWCSLRRDALLMWSYPEEEAAGLPASHSLSLRYCVSRRVELTSREECARPNTLRLFMLRQAGEADVDSLVVTRRADCVLEKCLISAESKKDEIEWADSLNDCLFLMRQLHAEQFRALEVKAKNLFNFG